MAATLDDLVTEVAAESTFDDSVAAFIAGLEAQLASAGADQTKIQAILDGLQANKAKLAAAITTPNSGPASTPAPVPN